MLERNESEPWLENGDGEALGESAFLGFTDRDRRMSVGLERSIKKIQLFDEGILKIQGKKIR